MMNYVYSFHTPRAVDGEDVFAFVWSDGVMRGRVLTIQKELSRPEGLRADILVRRLRDLADTIEKELAQYESKEPAT